MSPRVIAASAASATAMTALSSPPVWPDAVHVASTIAATAPTTYLFRALLPTSVIFILRLVSWSQQSSSAKHAAVNDRNELRSVGHVAQVTTTRLKDCGVVSCGGA